MQEQISILVIDDEQIMRDGCSRILSKDGWAVITAENGARGIDQIKERPEQIGVVLLDLMMPGMSGMEVLDQVRAIQPNLLIIVITGYATVESAVEAMKKGAYDFIPKPFTPDQLRIVVRRALERTALQKEADFLRKERERSLRDIATEKSKIKTIINCMGDGVLVCDQEGCVVLANPAANRMLKIPETSLLGHFLHESSIHPELSQTILESLKAKDKPYTSVSQELGLGEHDEIFIRAHTAPVRNDLGDTMGSVTVLQDISHLKELEKMKSEFIAMVTHELRAPITVVEQQLNVILNKLAGELTEKQEELLLRAKERTKGVLTLIKDLLDLSKIEAGKMVQYKEPLALRDVIEKVIELIKMEAEAKKIDLQVSCTPETCTLNADPNNMEEIFTNLLSNAIKYTPERGKVCVSLGEEGGFVKATVSDTGIGIKKEDLSHIFDKFYRVKAAETRQIIGTGLGLSIVKSMVDAHLGTISVESELGKGTTFTVLFPKESTPTTCRARSDEDSTV
jgi:two-component system, OmpR family, phosphate regulon sensor histidine kinase PhoR